MVPKAVEFRAALLDVQRDSLALWHDLGPERTLHYFFHADDGRRDDTHFNPPGAGAVARLVATGLLTACVLTGDEVRRLDEDVPDAWFRWLDEEPA